MPACASMSRPAPSAPMWWLLPAPLTTTVNNCARNLSRAVALGAGTGLCCTQWPLAIAPTSAQMVAIAGAIDDDREQLRARAVVPDSGRVWWLAQMRGRREATQAAGRPITAAQVIAFACAMGLLGACFGATSAWFQSALHRAGSSLAAFKFQAL